MHDQLAQPARPAETDASPELGPVAAVALFVLVAVGLLAAWSRLLGAEVVRGGARDVALVVAAVTAGTLVLVRVRRRRLPMTVVLLGLLGAAGVSIGLPDLPPWPSSETFGQSPRFGVVAALVAGLALLAASTRPRPDAALAVFLGLATAGGALFARRADAFLPLLALVAAVGLWPGRGARLEWRRTPFLATYGLLLAWLLVAAFTAVDVDRHWTGWSRVAVAAFPLIVLGAGPPRLERAWSAVAVVLATVLGASLAAALTLGEAAAAIDLRHALSARLSLFGIHPNLVAPFFTVTLPLAAAFVLGGRGVSARLLGLSSFAAAAAMLLLTRSRAATAAGALALAAFVGLLLLYRLWRVRPRRSTVVAMILLAVLGAALAWAVGHERVAAKLQDSSMAFRVYLWGVADDAIAARPWLGYGLLTGEPLAVHATPSDLDGTSKNVHPHNVGLAFALGAGLPAAALYLALLLVFAVRVVRTFARLDGRGRVLAAGSIASAVGLFAANLLDLGLSNHTPIALHLGLLLGVGAVLIRCTRDESAAAAPSRWPAIGLALSFGLAVLWSVVSLAGEAGAERSRLALARGDLVGADRWTAALRRLNPHDLQLGMLRVQVLRRAAREQAARTELLELAARHPLSPVPREALSGLELGRNRSSAALDALIDARRLDPTGPLASEWSLRVSRIELRLGRRGPALEALAEALRFDTQVARRVEWKRDAAGRWVTGDEDVTEVIALDEVLALNRALLPRWVREDMVRARRAASALAYTYRDFEMKREALAVIGEYDALGGAPFVPLQFLKTEIQDEFDGVDRPADDSEREGRRFHESGDEAGTHLAEGRKLRELGRYDEASARLVDGVAAIRDFASERETLTYLSQEILWLHLARGAVDAARASLPLALYAARDAGERIARVGEVVDGLLEVGRGDAAARTLERALAAVPYLVPGRDEAVVDAFATRLLRVDEAAARALGRRLSTSGAGLAISARYQRARGDDDALQRTRGLLRREFPAWAE